MPGGYTLTLKSNNTLFPNQYEKEKGTAPNEFITCKIHLVTITLIICFLFDVFSHVVIDEILSAPLSHFSHLKFCRPFCLHSSYLMS